MASAPIIYPTKEAWLAERQKRLGASEAAAALGLSPYDTPLQLWLRKTGRLPAQPETPAMKRGRMLEPAVAEWYAEETGRKVTFATFVMAPPEIAIYPSAALDFLTATPDRVVRDPGSEQAGNLQLKTTHWRHRDAWADGKVPVHYQVQVQIELHCTGLPWGSIACLIGGESLAWSDYLPDPRALATMLERLERFWWHVTHDQAPNEVRPEDLEAIKEAFRVAPPEAPPLLLDGEQTPRAAQLWTELRQGREAAKAAESVADEAEGRLRMLLGHATEARGEDGAVYVARPREVKPATCKGCGAEIRKGYTTRPLSRKEED